jgi:aspartyl-tRNA(Asn)/glutamyl-tRNA(Gln) amidotransferase subunit A
MPYQTIAAAAAGLRSGAVTATDLLERSLQAIDRHNPWTNAFIRIDRDDARRAARVVDDERSRGLDRGPLHGIPISLKDLIDVAGQPTTAASYVFKDRIATRDAPVVTRLRQAGAVILGKTNLHEFALGTTSEESAFGPVKHPQDASRSAGGSSGGSAAAVATGMGLGSIGTDTGGSIRIPSAACGVVGLKPTAGEIPTQGIVPLSWSLDHAGPIARTVQDVAWMWSALADQPLGSVLPPEVTTLRLGKLGGYFGLADREVGTAFERAIEDLRASGATITEQSLTNTSRIPQVYANIVLPEAAVVHVSYLDTRAAEYTPAVRSRIESGRTIPAVAYLHACAARTTLRGEVDALLDGCDALVLPTLPIVAPVIGSSDVALDNDRGEPLTVRAAMLRQTQLFNMTGHPAITLPLRTAGLPVGFQLVGHRGQTPRLLAIAAAVELLVSPHVDAGVSSKADASR